jgi:hypothetical protein
MITTEQTQTQLATQVSLRAPAQVMRLSRLGSFHQTRLSFMRQLLRRLVNDSWQFERTQWQVDSNGVGTAVYTASGPERSYSLIAFAHDLDPALRSDRVIAEAWDATFALYDGVPGAEDIERLRDNVPLQEAGRISESELSLSRANRSVRLFNYVRECLAAGKQPDQQQLGETGYLMRTTAVYGSGKFGAIDRRFVADRPELASPFQGELLAVYMIRQFSIDIVEHLARCDSPETAVTLDATLAKGLGIGNSTGLGMAPFLVNHPTLLNNWILARETALARVRSVKLTDAEPLERFVHYLQRQRAGVSDWHTQHDYQQTKIDALTADLAALQSEVERRMQKPNKHELFWDSLFIWAEQALSEEGQECLVTLLLETYPQLTDEFADTMSINEDTSFKIDASLSLGHMQQLVTDNYGFAMSCDFDERNENALFWYASEEKLEPRLGRRFDEPGAEREHPLAVARDVAAFAHAMESHNSNMTLAEFLLQAPEHRHVVRRIQQAVCHPYAEIADNLIADGMLPIDLLRCKLAFFGAVKFDPRSDRWLRITLFQHAPLISELQAREADDGRDPFDSWVYPPVQSAHG